MRKLKLQVQVSVDGFMTGPQGEMDWLTHAWDEALKQHVTALTDPVDTILLGRKLAEGFIPYWAANPGEEGAAKFNQTPKVVFSKTLSAVPWENTRLATAALVDEIAALKSDEGGDLIAYGAGEFVAQLIGHGLIDEYHLFVNPVALGSGRAVFPPRAEWLRLSPVEAKAFPCGIVALCFVPQR